MSRSVPRRLPPFWRRLIPPRANAAVLHSPACFIPPRANAAVLCSDKFLLWMDQQYNGIYRGKDHFDNWLHYAAKNEYPDDPQRRDALLFMLLVACSPVKAWVKMHKVLRVRGWRNSQIRAMAPFAAFHAARITVLWQAGVPCVSEEEAANDALWTVKVPDGELW